MKRIGFYAIQWTWGFVQNIVGLFVLLKNKECERSHYSKRIVTYWNREQGLSLGMFLFLPEKCRNNADAFLLKHEYGHSIQSMILGPFYFIVIGIPSFVWCNCQYFEQMRNTKNISYYDFFTEKWANELAGI